ncbi:unnamed protein product [Diplocarpon coronariae]
MARVQAVFFVGGADPSRIGADATDKLDAGIASQLSQTPKYTSEEFLTSAAFSIFSSECLEITSCTLSRASGQRAKAVVVLYGILETD